VEYSEHSIEASEVDDTDPSDEGYDGPTMVLAMAPKIKTP
jgi:hypothetical protein